jgi:8-oxo-dGTP diphosphatase
MKAGRRLPDGKERARGGAGTIAVVAAVIELDGKYLIARRRAGKANAGFWEFPGGKIEPGESPRAALVRELMEEFGVRIEAGSPFLQTAADLPEGGRIDLLAFMANLPESERAREKFSRSADHDLTVWADAGDLPRYRFTEADAGVVNELIRMRKGAPTRRSGRASRDKKPDRPYNGIREDGE